MKKVLLFAAVLFGLAACQNDPKEIGANMGSEQDVNILVSLESGTRTSSADSAEGAFANIDFEAEGLTLRYIFQVWDEKGEICKEKQYEYRTTTEMVTFPVRLIPGRNYNFVVWADIVDATAKEDVHYNTSDLRKITLNDWNAMDETRDAYTGFWSNTYTGNDNITITLTRPFAKLRVVTDDMNELLGVVPAKATVSYSSQVSPRTSFNALTGKAGARCQETVTHNYGLTENIYNESGNSKTLFSDYFFVAESDIVNFTLTVKEANDTDIITRTFNTAIPVKRNNLTTIEGNILTVGDEIKVNINDQFTQPGENINIYSGPVKETITLDSGLYIFNDLIVDTTSDNAVVIAENADVTIDIVGNVSLKSAGTAISVPASSTLTINGVSETRNAERNGALYVEAKDGSAIGGGNIIIQNIASLTAKANGNNAFGIGGENANVTIDNTTIDYVCGGHIQALFVNDLKYGKSEPEGGAAIGGATITINNSTITKAEGGSKAAAIGNRFWQSTEVVIKNSTLVEILGGNASAGIGGSRYSSDISADNKQISKIKIENSTVNAVGGQAGAGIGSGYDTHCAANDTNAVNEIVIINSTVTAQGGKYAAGIGTGYHAAALTGSIDAASTINATAGEGFYKDTYTHAQNIGYGVVDPAREFNGVNVTFTVAGEVINTPKEAVREGLGKIEKDGDVVYNIYSEEGLDYIAEQVNAGNEEYTNAEIVLDGDIDLSQFAMTRSVSSNWVPMGTSEHPFEGSFDGNGCTIKNLTLVETEAKEGKAYIGFFGYAKDATIKNVTFENVYINIPCLDIDHSQGHIGAVAGSLEGTSTIEDVTVKGDIRVYATQDANGASRVAVIAGGNSNGNVTMKNVHVIANEGSYLTANNNTGALAGQLQGKMVFENCSSNIDVTVNKFFAGGLVGIAAGDSTFTNCHTTGDVAVVAGREGRHNDEYRVGGIAGGWADGKTKVCTLTNCTYTGNVSGKNADGSVAEPLDYAGYVGRGYTLTNCAGSKVVIDDVEYVQVFDNLYGVYSVNGKTILNNDAQFKQAIASGMTEINLGEGEFNLPMGLTQKEGTLTITGSGSDKTTLRGARNENASYPGNYANGVELVFNNLKFVTANNGYNGGFGHAKSVTFSNSAIIGQFYAHSNAPHYFYDCTIDPQTGYLYTYGSDCLFERCTFRASEGRALQVYEDGPEGERNVTITDCTFTAAKQASTWDGKPVTAIDINSNGAKFNVRITNSTSEGFPVGLNSGSNLWNVKDGGKAYANVYVDDVQVWYAGCDLYANGLFKKGNEYIVVNAQGLVTLSNTTINGGESVKLGANIDLKDVEFNGLSAFNPENPNTFDGAGHTVSNWTYNGNASDMGFIKSWTGTIKSVNFDNCHLKTAGRSAVVAANVYANIKNVSVDNCSIEDSYWACGIIAGLYNSGSISNCTVTNSSVKANGGTGGIVGVINETGGERAVMNCSVTGSRIHNTGAYGADYSGGGIVGMLNAENATYKFINCEVSGNEMIGDHYFEKYPTNGNVITE